MHAKVQTSYHDDYWLHKEVKDIKRTVPLVVEGVDLDLRLQEFEFASLILSDAFDSPRPLHLKATGKIKFQGKVVKTVNYTDDRTYGHEKYMVDPLTVNNDIARLVGDISLSGLKLNQLLLAPQLAGSLCISHEAVKVR